MGPEGGTRGGMVVAEGTPEEVAATPGSYTGEFLAPLLEGTSRPAAEPRKAARQEGAGQEGDRQEAPAKTATAQKAPAKKATAKKSP